MVAPGLRDRTKVEEEGFAGSERLCTRTRSGRTAGPGISSAASVRLAIEGRLLREDTRSRRHENAWLMRKEPVVEMAKIEPRREKQQERLIDV